MKSDPPVVLRREKDVSDLKALLWECCSFVQPGCLNPEWLLDAVTQDTRGEKWL